MKLKLPLIFSLVFMVLGLNAQPPGMGKKKGPSIKGTIKGQLIDTTTNSAIGFATISMRRAGTERIIDGILTEEDGSFKLREVVNGKYDLSISFLGYEQRDLKDVEVTLKDPTTDLGNVFLLPSNYVLDEVQITEKRALIENKVDKIVFNAEDDASISGGDATDVLRKVPMLAVDLEGNVSIRGSQNIKILINGKPSGMFSNNVAEALKMFPADEIKKVEVITAPGAKYDAEGSGGIINIVTKKSDVEGIAGTLNGSGGTRSQSLNLNLNAGKGRFGFSSNGSLYYSLPNDAPNSFFREDQTDSGTRIISQEGIQKTSRLGFRGTASAFYDLNAYNSFNTSITYRGHSMDGDGLIDAMFMDPVSGLDDIYTRDNINETLFTGYDWNTDYTRKFENNEDREFTIAIQVSGDVQNQDYQITEVHSLDFLNRRENIFNDGDNLETTLQLDYTHPIADGVKLEVGAKSVLRDIDSDYQYELYDEGLDDFILDDSRSNLFFYDQDVYAGYASTTYSIGKFNLITGVRYEHTTINGDFQNGEAVFGNEYSNLLPNFAIARPLKNFRNLKFSYNQRIQRPSLFFINPFTNNVDRINQTIGNPELNPEKTHQFELSYNFRLLGFNIFSSGYYRKTLDIIEQVLSIDDIGRSITTYENVGENNSVGINIFSNKSIGRFSFRLGGDLFTYNATGVINGQELSSDAINYRVFTGGDFAITGDFKADFFGFFNSPKRTLQGDRQSFSMFGMGLRKEINNWSIGVRIIEPFKSHIDFKNELQGSNPEFYQTSVFSFPIRSFGISLRYKFGKVDFKERKSKIKNTDLKSGDGGGGQGGQQGGTSGNNG